MSPRATWSTMRGWLPIVGALARRPRLWPTAWRQAGRLAPDGWARRAPFLPLPDPAYVRFRMVTQYGDPSARPAPDDVLAYLGWCRRWHAGAP